MLLREGAERNDRLDLRLAIALSAIAGGLNSAGFYAFGRFSANMTGNASSASDFLALGDFRAGASFLLVIAAFILGAFAASYAIDEGRRRDSRTIYALVLAAEAACLAALGLLSMFLTLDRSGFATVLALAFLMGGQNALTTKISGGRVRTTHVSGMATDVGIAAAGLLRDPAARIRLRLYLFAIIAFILGGIAGVMLYRTSAAAVFFAASALLFTATAFSLATLRRRDPRR